MPSSTVRTSRAVIAIALATAISAPAFAAADMFLQLGPVKGESSDRLAGGKVQLSSIHFSASRKGWDGTVKGRTAIVDESPPSAAGAGKFGAVSGAHRDDGVSVAGDAPSGMPTEKRQHGNVKILTELDRGSVTMGMSLPGCAVGTQYESAEVTTPDGHYALTDVVVASCGDAVTLNYAKVKVRGWNPETKEQ